MPTNLLDIWTKKHPGGDYAAGVRLLQAAGWGGLTRNIQAALLTAMVSGQWTDYLKGKLKAGLVKCKGEGEALEKITEAHPNEAPPPTFPHDLTPLPAPPPEGRGADGGKLTSAKAVKLHKEHSHLHALLIAAKTDRERGTIARKIMEEIIPALDREYDRLRAGISDTDDRAEIHPAPGMNELALIRRQNSLRARVSKLRNQLIPTAPNLARKQELEKELAAKLDELDGINRQLADALA